MTETAISTVTHIGNILLLLLLLLLHRLGHMHLTQTHNHASIRSLVFFTDRMPFLPPNQQRQSTEGKH